MHERALANQDIRDSFTDQRHGALSKSAVGFGPIECELGTHARDDPEMLALRYEIGLDASLGCIGFPFCVHGLAHRLDFRDHLAYRDGSRVFPVRALERDESGDEQGAICQDQTWDEGMVVMDLVTYA